MSRKESTVSLDGMKFENKEGFLEVLKLVGLEQESVAIAHEFEQSTEDAGRIRDKELASLN